MNRSQAKKQIALAYPLAVPHLALLTQGVSDYAREHGGWTFIASPTASSTCPDALAMPLESLVGWDGDGAIAEVTTRDQERVALDLGIPVINLSGTLRDSQLPRAMVDHKAIGRQAAEHLLDAGLERFAYFGTKGVWYADQRRHGFINRIAEAGCCCEVLETEQPANGDQVWRRASREIDAWLGNLRPPVGILAVHDYHARVLIDACDHVGLQMPNDVSLIGVDNHATICEFCDPPLSSVSRNGRRVGYEVARLLDRIMAGEAARPGDLLIPPDGVVRRRSTDVVAFDDPDVTVCARYIRDHVEEVYGVERLLKLVAVSRRTLETHFKRCTGQTLCDTITRRRVQRAMELLGGSKEMVLEEVAAASGFPDSRALRRAFRRFTGTTPGAWSPGGSCAGTTK